MDFNEIFAQCPDSQVLSNLKKLHEHISPANENDYIPDQYYYTPDDFNNFLKENFNKKEQVSNFTCYHFNCRSLPQNFDTLNSFLSSLTLQSSIIGLTETWLNKNCSLDLYNINNYTFISNARNTRRGGGVGMYVRNGISYERRYDLDVSNNSSESIFAELDTGSQKILVGVIYRPPNQPVDDFLKYINDILQIVHTEKKLFYLMGDFNINILNVGNVQYVDEFLDTMLSNSMFPLIKYPTRVSSNSFTLIDNIFTNDYSADTSGLFLSDISDHFPIFCIVKKSINNSKNENVIFKRDINDDALVRFAQHLYNIQWDFNSMNANECYNEFLDTFLKAYDSFFPVKQVKLKNKSKNEPWFNDDIRKVMKKKNRSIQIIFKKSN